MICSMNIFVLVLDISSDLRNQVDNLASLNETKFIRTRRLLNMFFR
jgi:hypothetical protein